MSKRDLTQGNVLQTLVVFSAPFMLSTLLQTLYSMVDMVVVGQFVGSDGLSAVSTGGMLMDLIAIFCVGFSTAGQIVISQQVGAQKQDRITITNQTLCLLIFCFAAVLTVVGLAGGPALLALLNTPPEAVDYARQYVFVCSCGILFTGFYNMISAIFRGMGDSLHPLLFIAIAAVSNTVLDVLFVGGWGLGVAGAAAATVVGQAISVVFSLVFLLRHAAAFHFDFDPRHFRPDKTILRTLFRLGIPLAVQSSAINISFLFVNSMVNSLGVAVSATFGAGQKLRNIPNIMTQAVSLGATSMVGQCFGAGLYDRVGKIYRSGILVCGAICAVCGAVFLLFPRQMFMLFTQEEAVLAYAPMFMFVLALEVPAKAVMPSGGALIAGCGNTRLSMTLAFLDAFAGRVLLTWLCGSYFGMGAFGYFLGYALATYITAIPQTVYSLMGTWRKRKRLA